MERLHILIPLEREAPHSAASRSPVKLAANKSQGRSAISPQRCHVGAAGAVRGCDNGLEVKTAPHSNYTADLSHIVKTSHQRARWMGHGRCGIQSLCAVPVAHRTTKEAGDSCFPLRRIYNSTYVRLTRRMSADDATRTTLIGEGGIRPRYGSVMSIGDGGKGGALVKNAINESRMKTSLMKWVCVQAHIRIV